MERQSSVIKVSGAASPSVSAPNNATSPTNHRPRRRNPKANNWLLFGILKGFAILGPIGFACNIIYFTIYMHQSDYHLNFHELHPLSTFSKSLHHRLTAMGLERSDGLSPVVLSGSDVLKGLQQRVKRSWNECGGTPRSALALTKQYQHQEAQQQQQQEKRNSNLRGPSEDDYILPPFGFLKELDQFFKQPPSEVNATQQCQIPQRGMASCDEEGYSIVVTFQGANNFRPLFMNLLSWLTYPAVTDILVLMPHADWSFEGQTVMDTKYKNRIQAWHTSKDHKVNMLGLPQTLDPTGDPTSKFSVHSLLTRSMEKIGSKAVLFMDGATLWDGNQRGLEAGFELWKQNPHGLIATHKLDVEKPTTDYDCESQSSDHDRDSLWGSFCEDGAPAIPKDLDLLYEQYQNILDLHGVFVHRDMLCLIQRPPLSTILTQKVWPKLDDNSDPVITLVYLRSMLAMMLQNIAGTPPLLFPARIARPQNETKNINNNWHYLSSVKERDDYEANMIKDKLIQQSVIFSILGYFGAGLAEDARDGVAPYWCSSSKQGAEDVFLMSDIAWLQEEGGCASVET